MQCRLYNFPIEFYVSLKSGCFYYTHSASYISGYHTIPVKYCDCVYVHTFSVGGEENPRYIKYNMYLLYMFVCTAYRYLVGMLE